MGALGSFVDNYTAVRLAHDIDADLAEVYCWIHGDRTLSIRRAIQISEIARSAGTPLSLEDIYEADIVRVRCRMRSRSARLTDLEKSP
jgi:hypothetical protein